MSNRDGTQRKPPIKPSPAISGDFAGFVLDDNRVQLRAVKRVNDGAHRLTVISNVPVTPELLRQAASELGSVTLFTPDAGNRCSSRVPLRTRKRLQRPSSDKNHVTTKFGGADRDGQHFADGHGAKRVEAGTVPPPANSLDIHFPFATRFNAIDWRDGKQSMSGLLLVDTRPSLLYGTLFSSLGENAGIFIQALLGIGIFFGVIELIALIIGGRLTRSVTRSVAELYSATQYVNQGELRIASRSEAAIRWRRWSSRSTR